MEATEATVLKFWFEELTPEQQFKKDKQLDMTIRDRFLELLERTIAGECASWRLTAQGCLAQIIVLDQFSRNIFRDSARAFAQDSLALAVAQDAIQKSFAQQLNVKERAFLYMPFMHSESLMVHEHAVKLFSEPGLEMNLDFEYKHKVIIEEFGRYPHRNKILGRVSTPEEIEFLKQPNSSF